MTCPGVVPCKVPGCTCAAVVRAVGWPYAQVCACCEARLHPSERHVLIYDDVLHHSVLRYGRLLEAALEIIVADRTREGDEYLEGVAA